MSPVRDHQGVVIPGFNGLWKRGNDDTCPIDHFSNCVNIDFVGEASFRTRPGIGISQSVSGPVSNIRRIYNYPTQTANTILLLAIDSSGNGNIYHIVNSTTVYGPILTVAGMTDFAFVPYAGRAYISPFTDYTNGALTFQSGMSGQNLQVYAGDGTAAQQAAGSALSGTITPANGAAGHTDAGLKVFAFVSQTKFGYNAPPGGNASFTTSAGSSVSFTGVPTGASNVVKRLLVATKTIQNFNGDLNGYQFFFVPNAVINDNTTTTLSNISFYDADLLSDASHLINNYTAIPAGSTLGMYHNRLVLACTNANISLILVSAPGEPEAIDQIAGIIVVPLDGNPITNAQEMRDILYAFKRSQTVSYSDNDGYPSSWPLVPVDPSVGTCPHGIATVLDSGKASVDSLLIATYRGIEQFNGKYPIPQQILTWKIDNYWKNLDRNGYGKIQLINNPIERKLYCTLPSRLLLVGDYQNGLDYKNIRWCPWNFSQGVNAVAIQNTDDVIIGSDIGF